MIAVIALCLAAVMAARGIVIVVAETLRARRLAPVRARVTRNQMRMEWVTDQFRHDDHQPAQKLETVHTVEWEYAVDGVTHRGERSAPMSLTATMPPQEITVLYDRRNPSVSRLGGETAGNLAAPWFIFAGVIAAVGVLIQVVSGFGE